MNIDLEQDAIVVFVGPMGVGKSTFAKKHFTPSQVLETDKIRENLTGDFECMDYDREVFDILYHQLEVRARLGFLTVVDSTGSRKVIQRAYEIAKEYKRPLYAFVFPPLKESEITPERMKHRMKYIHAYYRQVERIKNTVLPDDYKIHIINTDNVVVCIERYDAYYRIQEGFDYVVIPDLHGEYRFLEHILKEHPDKHYICLGDIVDRGESSYRTFRMVYELIQENRLVHVTSNHDNKLYRYFKKFKTDQDETKYSAPSSYGMTIAYGLNRTLSEFFSLSNEEMDRYVDDFIDYYEKARDYLKLEQNGRIHYFTHAGISQNMISGLKLTKRDKERHIYETIDETVKPDIRALENIVFHVGHDAKERRIHVKYDNIEIVKHDIGIGKREVTETDFLVIYGN